MNVSRKSILILLLAYMLCLNASCHCQPQQEPWPQIQSQAKPWTYWWWMGSAVDKENITSQLEAFQKAGLGGVHIIPIYGAKGYEDRYIEYLSPKWMEMLDYTVTEAGKLGMGVDMTLGTGWCFGGPKVTGQEANAVLQHQVQKIKSGQKSAKLSNASVQAVIAYGPDSQIIDLSDRIQPDQTLDWTAPQGEWTLYELWQKPSGRKVKRAAPGGQGHMLNPFYKDAIDSYLQWFDQAFDNYNGRMPRAIYHDSYEYVCDWSPNLLDEFERRRGYRLQDHLPEFFAKEDSDVTARLKSDYRQTISEMMTDDFTDIWVGWAHQKGLLARNEAHGSPANLLDLYASADMAETEFFRFDRNPLVAKFASSASHVAGHPYTSSETGTWLKEHFHVTLGHLKNFIDGLFVSGINHMFYHGTCYSPAEAPWPGWVFYASTEMNPRNSIWYDADALNGYLARCQSVLQAGTPDNDILLYWPINDLWHDSKGMTDGLTVHHTDWLTKQPIGPVASMLWKKGYTFDYISDWQLQGAEYKNGIKVEGGIYQAIVVPACDHMPIDTMQQLYKLAQSGTTIIFDKQVPKDVPGLGNLTGRQSQLKAVTVSLKWQQQGSVQFSKIGKGMFLTGSSLQSILDYADIQRETLVDHEGLEFIRRADSDGNWYFITNQDDQFTEKPGTKAFDGWVALSRRIRSVTILDPMSSQTGQGTIRLNAKGQAEVYLQIAPGQSLILRTYKDMQSDEPEWAYYHRNGTANQITGTWNVKFIQGGPELPASYETSKLQSWTESDDPDSQKFAGTARYTIVFDVPTEMADAYQLDLGTVCSSAKIELNGHTLPAVFSEPFVVQIPGDLLKPKGNLLQINVTNLAINRIRDLDHRGVKWTYFNDINFVNIDYKPFNASKDPLMDSGLLGPVMLYPLMKINPNDMPHTKPTLYIIGDSTVKNHTRGLLGWGDPVADYFDRSKIDVQNHAIGGRSSRTFQTEGRWQTILDQLKPGDFVLMQFGHNDGGSMNTGRARGTLKGIGDQTQEVIMELTGKTEIIHTYGWYMSRYVIETLEKGATPIVLSPIPRNRWDSQGHVYRASNDYGKWAREIAELHGAYFIDLNEAVALKYEQIGPERVGSEYFLEDHTHTTTAGAKLNAATVIEGIKELKNCSLRDYIIN